MNYRTFITEFVRAAQKETVRRAVNLYFIQMSESFDEKAREKAGRVFSDWLKDMRTRKWRGKSIKTISCMASYTGKRPEALRAAFEVLSNVARREAERRAKEKIHILDTSNGGILPAEKEVILKEYAMKADNLLLELAEKATENELPF